jgi:hypothetical protein
MSPYPLSHNLPYISYVNLPSGTANPLNQANSNFGLLSALGFFESEKVLANFLLKSAP